MLVLARLLFLTIIAGALGVIPAASQLSWERAGTPVVGPENGSLVVVGGAMRSPQLFERFIQLAGGPDANIVLVPTAGEEDDYDNSYRGLEAWRANGARNLTVLHTRDPVVADTDEFVEPLRTADGVFFFGGRQWRLVDIYGDTKTEEELQKVLDRGGVIGGSSAGASVLASFLVRGDTSGNDIMMGDHQRGFSYLRNVGIDQHLLRRNRQFDMIEVIEAHPELLGIGLDEDTGVVVRGDRFQVVGPSYAVIYDNQSTTGEDGKFFFLSSGQIYDMGERQVVQPQPLQNVEQRPWSN